MYGHRFAMSPTPKSAKRPAKATLSLAPSFSSDYTRRANPRKRLSKLASRGSGNTAAKRTLTFW